MSHSFKTWAHVLVIYAAGLGAAGQFAKLSAGFAGLESVYPESGAQLGLAISIISFLGVAFGLAGGIIVNRLGVRRVLLMGLLLGAALSWHQSLLPDMPIFLISRLAEGAAHLAIVIAAPTLIAEITNTTQRPVAMALWSTFFGAGFALYSWLGTPFVATYGPEILMQFHAVWMLAVAAISAIALPMVTLPAPSERLTLGFVLRRHVQVYQSATMSAPALGWLCYTLTFVSVLTLLPILSQNAPTLGTTLPLISIFFSMTLVAWILRYKPAVPVIMVGFGLATLMIPVIAVYPDQSLPWLMLFAILAAIQAGTFAAIPQLCLTAQERALANGAVAQMGNLGNLIGTPILLAVLTGVNLTAGLGFLAVAYAAGLAFHMALATARVRTSR